MASPFLPQDTWYLIYIYIYISDNKEKKLSKSQITPFVLCLKDNPVFLPLPSILSIYLLVWLGPYDCGSSKFLSGCEYEILTFHHLWHENPNFWIGTWLVVWYKLKQTLWDLMKASIVPPQHWISTILIKLSVYFKGFGGKNI